MKITLTLPQSDLLADIHAAGKEGMVVPGTKGGTAKVLRGYELIADVPDTQPPKQRTTTAGLVWLAEHREPTLFPCPSGIRSVAWELIRPVAIALCSAEVPCLLGWTKPAGEHWPAAILAFPVDGEAAVTVLLRPSPAIPPRMLTPSVRTLRLTADDAHGGPVSWTETEIGAGLPTAEIVREVLKRRRNLLEDRATARRCKGSRVEADRLNEAVGVDPVNSIADVRADVRVSTGELIFHANVVCNPEQAAAMLDCAKRLGLIPETSR